MSGKHARLSPSSAVRWAECPASVVLDDRLRAKHDGELPDDSSVYAEVGTLCHEYAELLIKQKFWPDGDMFIDRISALLEKIRELGNEDSVKNAETYFTFVKDFVSDFRTDDLDWNLETRFPLWYEPGSAGTCDFWAVHKSTKTLYILDYKSGRIEVNAYKNPQLSIYALAAYDELKRFNEIETVKMGISQPLYRSSVDWWEAPVTELEHVREQIDRVVREIQEPMFTPRFGPSDKACQWCRHKANCKARAQMLGEDFGKPLEEVTDEEALAIFSRSKGHRAFLDAIEQRIREMDEDARAAGGYKLVRGSQRRSWDDEEEIAKFLEARGVDPWERKMKTVAAIEREVGKDDPLVALHTKIDYNKASIVPVSDRRRAISNEEV